MTDNYDYDHYLDLCLDIISEEKYERTVEEIIKIGKKEWIKANTIQGLFFFPDSIYIFFEYLPNTIDILFVFINMDTFEISTAICYNKSQILS